MYIEQQKVHGLVYLRLMENTEVSTEEGPKKKKRLVYTIGRLDTYDDGRPNYLERLRRSFREGHPLIPALEQYVDVSEDERTYHVRFHEGTSECAPVRTLFAGELLGGIFRELGLDRLFARIQTASKIQYNLAGTVRLLTMGRLLSPDSKWATMKQNYRYFDPPLTREDEWSQTTVYRTLDVIYANWKRILRTIDRNIRSKRGRDTTVVLYDVTNIFCQIDKPDEDIEIDGELVGQGFRKRGMSKEGRKKPIVQVSLFADREGLPLSLEVFPGNVPDVSTTRPSLKAMPGTTEPDRFIFVADRGNCSGATCLAIEDEGMGYVISKSILNSPKEVREWILDDTGWTEVSENFKYKSQVRTDRVKDADGKFAKLKQKYIVHWSRARYEKDLNDHNRMVEFLEHLRNEEGYVPAEKLEPSYVKKSFRKFLVVKEENGQASGEVIAKKDLLQIVNLEQLEEDIRLFGYYQIVTSELETPDLECVQLYSHLVQIEDEFRTLKGPMELRPVYVRTEAHLKAHFLICFIALTILRLMQLRIVEQNPAFGEDKKMWTWALSGKRIRDALNNWQIVQLPDEYYAFTELGGLASGAQPCLDLRTLLDAYGIHPALKLFTNSELKNLTLNIKYI